LTAAHGAAIDHAFPTLQRSGGAGSSIPSREVEFYRREETRAGERDLKTDVRDALGVGSHTRTVRRFILNHQQKCIKVDRRD
jgi:hypothetical protein